MLRNFISKKFRLILESLAKYLKAPNIIYDHNGIEPYLSRYYLFRGPRSIDGTHPFDEFGRPKSNILRTDKFSIVLHKFHKSDSSDRLHNHGWTWGLSFVLTGGYVEESLVDGKIIKKTFRPLMINFFKSHEYHRVDLIEKDAWTLFFRGPRKLEWFYKNRNTHEILNWNQHVKLGKS